MAGVGAEEWGWAAPIPPGVLVSGSLGPNLLSLPGEGGAAAVFTLERIPWIKGVKRGRGVLEVTGAEVSGVAVEVGVTAGVGVGCCGGGVGCGVAVGNGVSGGVGVGSGFAVGMGVGVGVGRASKDSASGMAGISISWGTGSGGDRSSAGGDSGAGPGGSAVGSGGRDSMDSESGSSNCGSGSSSKSVTGIRSSASDQGRDPHQASPSSAIRCKRREINPSRRSGRGSLARRWRTVPGGSSPSWQAVQRAAQL